MKPKRRWMNWVFDESVKPSVMLPWHRGAQPHAAGENRP